jgi:hypothetical protein
VLYPVGIVRRTNSPAYIRKRFDDYGEMIKRIQHQGAIGLEHDPEFDGLCGERGRAAIVASASV